MGQDEFPHVQPVSGPRTGSLSKALSREHRDALLVLGYVFLQNHQREKALVLLEALQVLFPKDTHIKLSLAYAYLINGRHRDALDLAAQCEKNTAPNAPGVFIEIRALWELDHRDAARQRLRNVIDERRAL